MPPKDEPSDDEREATGLAQIEENLAEIVAHVDAWIQDRFLSSATAAGLNLEDISGLILWLQQWHLHFDTYAETASSLESVGRPAMRARLAEIDTQIDASIESFTQMMVAPPGDPID